MLEAAERMPPNTRHVALRPQAGVGLVPLIQAVVATRVSKAQAPSRDADAGGAQTRPPSTRRAAALVFESSSEGAARLLKAMGNRKIKSAAIHGADGRPDEEHSREKRWAARAGRIVTDESRKVVAGAKRARGLALTGMAEGRLQVLCATDMLAHGVDVKGATHVINAAVPRTAAAYLHRAGRVGRTGGGAGTVISLPRTEAEAARLAGYAEELGFKLELVEPSVLGVEGEAERAARREEVARELEARLAEAPPLAGAARDA